MTPQIPTKDAAGEICAVILTVCRIWAMAHVYAHRVDTRGGCTAADLVEYGFDREDVELHWRDVIRAAAGIVADQAARDARRRRLGLPPSRAAS